MYKKIIVPLDGSELAECVLPHVETLTGGCGVEEVVLVRAAEPFYMPAGEPVFTDAEIKEIEDRHEAGARDYLAKIAKRVSLGGVRVDTVVLTGNGDKAGGVRIAAPVKAADMLVDYVKGSGADLIVISSHGRSGISRWIFGSVAERLLRGACVPVMMVRAPGCEIGV
ncbi:MAG: universal stress protein [Chloroflexota bacterium]